MRRSFACCAVFGCTVCTPDAEPSGGRQSTKTVGDPVDADREAPPIDTASRDPRRNPLAEPDFGERSRLKFDPAPPDLAQMRGTRPYVVGWSKSGEEFGYCVGAGGDSCSTCEFLDRGGNLQQLSDCEGESTRPDPSKTRQLEQRVAAGEYGLPDATWKYGEVTLVWDVIPAGSVPIRLRVGGRVDSRVPVYSVNASEEGYRAIWPELIWLSPEGDRVGILSHAYDEEGRLESFQVHVADVDELASMAYNGAGLLFSHGEQHEEAIDLFHKAAQAWSGQKWAMYNLACALARTDAPGTQAALTRAVERGGAEIRAKLATDPDLESVRDQPWFAPLAAVE